MGTQSGLRKSVELVDGVSSAVAHATNATLLEYTADRAMSVKRVLCDFALAADAAVAKAIVVRYAVCLRRSQDTADVDLSSESAVQTALRNGQIWYLNAVAGCAQQALMRQIDTQTPRRLMANDKIQLRMYALWEDAVAHDMTYALALQVFDEPV